MEYNEKKQRFEKIYREESDAIFRYVILRVSNKEDAKDIVQEVFTSFWRIWSSETPVKYPRPLIFTITRRKIIDWYRRKKTLSLEAMAELADEEVFQIPNEEAYEDVKKMPEVSIILEALNKLPPPYREVVYLRFIEDLGPVEIAEMLETSANAISIRLNRGIKELRDILKISEDELI